MHPVLTLSFLRVGNAGVVMLPPQETGPPRPHQGYSYLLLNPTNHRSDQIEIGITRARVI